MLVAKVFFSLFSFNLAEEKAAKMSHIYFIAK